MRQVDGGEHFVFLFVVKGWGRVRVRNSGGGGGGMGGEGRALVGLFSCTLQTLGFICGGEC